MKRNAILAASFLLVGLTRTSPAAQGAVTISCIGTNASEKLVVSENEVATVKSYVDFTMSQANPQQLGGAWIVVSRPGSTAVAAIDAKPALDAYGFFGSSRDPVSFQVAGPATIHLETGHGMAIHPDFWALLTVEIQPRLFPPDKATTIGPNAGAVGVAMEVSTNLVHWATATNGLVYTNSPAARFFRIKMEKAGQP